MVWCPPWEQETQVSNPAIFSWVILVKLALPVKTGTLVATLSGAWHQRIYAKTDWSGISILWLSEIASLLCSSSLSVSVLISLEQIYLRDTLACRWDAKRPTNWQTLKYDRCHWIQHQTEDWWVTVDEWLQQMKKRKADVSFYPLHMHLHPAHMSASVHKWKQDRIEITRKKP